MAEIIISSGSGHAVAGSVQRTVVRLTFESELSRSQNQQCASVQKLLLDSNAKSVLIF
jgi:hypothetical protein